MPRTRSRSLCVHTHRHQDGRSPSRIHSTTWVVHVSRLWQLCWDIPSHSTPTPSTRLSPCPPTSLHVLHVTLRSISRTRPRCASTSTHGLVHIMWKLSPTNSFTRLGSISRKSRNLAVWPRLSRQVCPRCVSRRLQPAHRHVSTQVFRPSSVPTSIASTMRILSTSSR